VKDTVEDTMKDTRLDTLMAAMRDTTQGRTADSDSSEFRVQKPETGNLKPEPKPPMNADERRFGT